VSAAFGRVEARFRATLTRRGGEGGGALVDGDRVVAAISGGLDSCVLLHLLRFGGAPHLEVEVAHLDHAMRPSSAGDARWLTGLCAAWALPLHVERAHPVPASEDEARRARYAFLEDVRRGVGAKLVLTAHHADDQAETVLFRALRGTGVAGLAGLPARREPGILRPLLEVWREELEAYASRVKLSWRKDPSNECLGLARNALRRVILPEAERLVAPGARRALVRLGRLAAEEDAAWASLIPELLTRLALRQGRGAVSLDRAALLGLHPAVQARLLRSLTQELGLTMDEAATRRAVGFAASGASGRRVELARSVELGRELDRLVIARRSPAQPDPARPDPARPDRIQLDRGLPDRAPPDRAPPDRVPPDRALPIPDAGPGAGEALLGGRRVPVAWGPEEPSGLERAEVFQAGELRFPLLVRAREPGDRIRLAGGTTKLKKVLLEARIPRRERETIPVVVDAAGEVLWVPGVARALRRERAARGLSLRIGIG